MVIFLQVFYSFFSALTLSLSLPNEIFRFGSPFLGCIALIPFYISIRSSKNFGAAFFNGFLFTFLTHLFSSFWLAFFKDFALFTLGASAIGTGIIGGVFGLFLFLPYISQKNKNELYCFSKINSFFYTPAFRILYFSAIYVLYEWVKSSGFLGYPWGLLSETVFHFPILMQIADITGTYGVSFLLAFINSFLAEILLFSFKNSFRKEKHFFYNSFKNITFVLLALFICTTIYGTYKYTKKMIPQKYLSTILVQQNSDPWKQSTDEEAILTSQQLTQKEIDNLTSEQKKADLVVWSEGCLLYAFPDSYSFYSYYPISSPLLSYIDSTNTPFIIGGSYIRDRQKLQVYNAALVFDEKAKFRGFYGKNHLVPFAEVIPGSEIPFIKNILTKVIKITAGWTPGDQYSYFDIPCSYSPNRKLPMSSYTDLSTTFEEQENNINRKPTVRICTPICFDDAFTDIMRPLFLNGAELFMNITDDSWSKTKSSEYQHFVIASYRAIEYRTTLVRSTNSGYSAIVSPNGKILSDMPLFEEASISYDIPIFEHKQTVYSTFGNWMPYTFAILFILYAFYMFKTFATTDYIESQRKLKKGKQKRKLVNTHKSQNKKAHK